MNRLAIRFTAALITFIIGLSITSGLLLSRWRPNRKEQQPVTIPSQTAMQHPMPTTDSDGLEIPGLSQSVVIKPRQKYNLPGIDNIYVTQLGTKGHVLATFALHGRQENGEVVFGEPRQLGVFSITRYDVNGQPFCYQLLGNIPGASALIRYDYYDDDGDGKFDRCVRGTWPRTPAIPKWVLSRR